MAARDNFRKPVIEALAARVGYRCSRPGCHAETAGPSADAGKAVNLGVAAHITAASAGGPRYDGTLTTEQRRSIDNGIWLCATDAKLIDSDLTTYTIELLQRWKSDAEARAEQRLTPLRRSDGPASTTSWVKVRDADPRRLGVHAAIRTPTSVTAPPPYVERDIDEQLRNFLTSSAATGAFVLLVGGSSAGKSRTAFEAIVNVFPDRRLIHPDETDPALFESLAQSTPNATIVWLDEIQRYLPPRGGLQPSHLQAILNAGAVVIGTIWPAEHNIRTHPPRRPGAPDPHAPARAILDQAEVFNILPSLSTPERRRAEALAREDERLRLALELDDGAGLTQALAAGPDLIRRWHHAPTPAARALITAAIDARRLGFDRPLTKSMLQVAAQGYLRSSERARLAPGSFDEAFVYATELIRDAASPLNPVADGRTGKQLGYRAADYLLYEGSGVRRTAVIPESLWLLLIAHASDEDTLLSLHSEADGRWFRTYCRLVTARLSEVVGSYPYGDIDRMVAEGKILQAREEVRYLAELCDDRDVTWMYISILEEYGYIDEAIEEASLYDRRYGHRPHSHGRAVLVSLLERHERSARLEMLADGGDEFAARALGRNSIRRGDFEAGLRYFGPQADAQHDGGYVRHCLADCLAGLGRHAELRAMAADSDYAQMRLMAALGEVEEVRKLVASGGYEPLLVVDAYLSIGRVDEAIEELREYMDDSDPGDFDPAQRLIEVLVSHGRSAEVVDELNAGNWHAGRWLIRTMVEQGEIPDETPAYRFGLRPDGTVDWPG